MLHIKQFRVHEVFKVQCYDAFLRFTRIKVLKLRVKYITTINY